MKRIDSVNAQHDKFGPGKNGFQGGNPDTGAEATALTPDWCDALQEEICNVIEAAGIALNPAIRSQLKAALDLLYMSVATGAWSKSIDGKERFFYTPNGDTVIRGHDGVQPVKVQNAAGAIIAQFLATGGLWLGADAVGANDATRLGQVTAAITAAILNTLGSSSYSLQNLTASRNLGTTYTNSTGRPIFVNMSFSFNAFINYLYLNGVMVQAAGSGAGGISGESGFSFMVRPGDTYMISGGGKNTWFETR
jgi:hypothetical protein